MRSPVISCGLLWFSGEPHTAFEAYASPYVLACLLPTASFVSLCECDRFSAEQLSNQKAVARVCTDHVSTRNLTNSCSTYQLSLIDPRDKIEL